MKVYGDFLGSRDIIQLVKENRGSYIVDEQIINILLDGDDLTVEYTLIVDAEYSKDIVYDVEISDIDVTIDSVSIDGESVNIDKSILKNIILEIVK